MVAKKFILKIMEEVVGEYIINISKQNLKVAVLRGKLKLDNVQLDGDLIGSHVLGAVGLSGFAVISCTAAHLRASIPWSKLEKEPTKFELVGLQLICVPLLPSNATRMHGIGSEKDPKCTLRTRVKRSTIARFERNFFSWRIPGEGPPRPTRYNPNEDRNNERNEWRKRGGGSSSGSNRKKYSGGGDANSVYSRRSSSMGQNRNTADDDKSFFNNYSNTYPDEGDIQDDMSAITSFTINEASGDKEKDMDDESRHAAWRQKLTQKILRNIEIGIRDLHIRCEVGEGSLNTSECEKKEQHPGEKSEPLFSKEEDESAFAFGFTIDSLVLRSANSNWDTGRNVDFEQKSNTKKNPLRASFAEEEADGVQDTKYKIFFVKNIAMYWDQNPPIILTECPLIQRNNEGVDAHKIWSVVRIAMEKMKYYQNPKEDVLNVLMGIKPVHQRSSVNTVGSTDEKNLIEHSYVISPTTLEIRLMLHNLGKDTQSRCQAEIMPCEFALSFSPKQMHQYRLLQYAMAAQQRLDTMVQQRPKSSPLENPRAWWRYAISCVTTRPRVRPWRDVVRIVRKRSRYVELVEKKHLNKDLGNLTFAESAELLAMEDMLPIETLLSFHLLALRNVQDIRNYESEKKSKKMDASKSLSPKDLPSPTRRKRIPTFKNSTRNDADENDLTTITSDTKSPSRLFDSHSNHGRIEKSTSFDATNRGYFGDLPRSPTKSPLPKNPGRGRRSQKKNGTKFSLSVQHRKSPNKRLDDEISFAESFASIELDSIVNGFDSASQKMEFSFDDMSIPGLDKDEEVGEPGMLNTIRCHDLSIIVRIMDKRHIKTVLKGNLRASTWIHHVPGDGVKLLFDLINLRFMDWTNKKSPKLLSFERPNEKCKNTGGFGNGIVLPLGTSNCSDDVFLENFCNEIHDGELALPPVGVVSRLLVSERPDGRSFSLSAHAATMVWNKKCVDAFMSTFFPSQKLETRSILQNQLRNAATPVVHKAQVALTAPKSLSINVNIEAPKVWFPVSQNKNDGALYVDVGKLTLSLKKPEFLAHMQWSIECKGMLAKFRRNASSVFYNNCTDHVAPSGDIINDIPIILPLDLFYEVEKSGDGPAAIITKNGVNYKRSKVSTLKLGKICVQLVDVEVLAKAIGQWYATQLRHVKRKQHTQNHFKSRNNRSNLKKSLHCIKDNSVAHVGQDLTVFVEKVELYLQGNLSSTQLKSTPHNKRTYLIELANIHITRSQKGCIRTTAGKLDYIYIAQMKDKRISEKDTKPNLDSQRTIMRCTPPEFCIDGCNGDNNGKQYAIITTFIHNEATHVDDLDMIFMHIETHVTTIALKDCYAAMNRILESIKIMTGEMERRVHEVGRNHRRDSQIQIYSSDTTHESELSLNSGYDFNTLEETSLILKVSLEKVALLVAGEVHEKNQQHRSGHIIEITSSALFMFQSIEDKDGSGSKTFHISLKDVAIYTSSQLKLTSASQSLPLIGPTQIEFRSVNMTENSGVVVSREVSVSCDALKASLLAHDAIILFKIMAQHLNELKLNENGGESRNKYGLMFSQRKGSSIATVLKFQLQPFSIVLMRRGIDIDAYPLLELRGEMFGKIEGCAHALFGDSRVEVNMSFFNIENTEWEEVVEPVTVFVDFEHQPNDLLLTTSITEVIKSNITSNLLVSLSEYQTEIRNRDNKNKCLVDKKPTNANGVKIINESGVDFFLCYMTDVQRIDLGKMIPKDNEIFHLLKDGQSRTITFDPEENDQRIALLLAPESEHVVGHREPILNIPLQCSDEKKTLKFPLSSGEPVDNVKYIFEPVVEWCMQNQRLRSKYHNVSAIDKGMDLLSNQIWSPSDRDLLQIKTKHWSHPYLDNDVYEWTDMTGVLRMEKDRVVLPDNKWIWANDWTIDLPGDYGDLSDGDGWEYSKDFQSFRQSRRYFKVGDTCRRRRWTRTRLIKPPKINDPLRPLHVVWTSFTASSGENVVNVTSSLIMNNRTNLDLSILGFSPSWERDFLLGRLGADNRLCVPLHLSSLTHLRLAIDDFQRKHPSELSKDNASDRILIIPKSPQSQSLFRASITLDNHTSIQQNLPRILHFSVKVVSSSGFTTITIDPIVYVENLLPCPLQFRLFEGDNNSHKNELSMDGQILDEQALDTGMKSSSVAVDSSFNPHISFRVPGYRWSKQQRIVNRKLALSTWRPGEQDDDNRFMLQDSNENGENYTTSIHFDRLTYGGDPLELVLEIVPGDSPSLRVFAQYWIIDKTGFGLRFCDGFGDLLGSTLKTSRPRRSYGLHKEKQNEAFLEDMNVEGHEWTIGMNGRTCYFSRDSKVAVSIDCGDHESPNTQLKRIKSNWSKLVDISNVIPKAIFSVAEFQGERKFDLSYDVSFAPTIYSRTKIVTIYNRFHLVNLSNNPYYVKQQDSGTISTYLPPKSTVPFHWESDTDGNKVQLSTDNYQWTPGCIQLDNVGVYALRIPNHDTEVPFVVQIEVRLAKNDFNCAVNILIWNADEQQNPLYKIVNSSSHTILCKQSHDEPTPSDQVLIPPACNEISQKQAETCIPKATIDLLSNGLNCGALDSDHDKEMCDTYYTWVVQHGSTSSFGLENSQNAHSIEWTCIELQNENISNRPSIDIDALGLISEQVLPSGKKICCTIRADRSTKVIEFFDFTYNVNKQHPILANLKDKLTHHKVSLSLQDAYVVDNISCDEEHLAFSLKFNLPGLDCSIIENSTNNVAGREVLLLSIENTTLTVSQTRDSYQEFELKILSLQVDNHIKNAVHPVMFACPYFKEEEPFLHASVVRKLNATDGNVFRYIAFRMLTADIALDRRTAETIATLARPFEWKDSQQLKDSISFDFFDVTSNVDIAQIIASKRIYVEQLHLHPIRISLTFTQDGESTDNGYTKSMIRQYISKVPSLSQAELLFTSFVVSHVFESPEVFPRIISAHYTSQFTNQLFSILGSLDILNGPADFLTNIGTGVRDFFYEPINGLVHGPDKFIEGLENGSISLARGIFLGFVRGAANVTYFVNSNLVNLTDEDFIDERIAYQRSISDSLTRSKKSRTISDSLHLAGVSIARGLKSGAVGLVDEPWQNFTRHGPVGLVKGMGKALVGAVVKPMIGVGDGAVVVMNHVSELTSDESMKERIPKRLRRALPRKASNKKNSVMLVPYNDKAAKAQRIVTANDTKDDAYLCHVNITQHLIIASDKFLWIINRTTKVPNCLNWEQISHFGMIDDRFTMQITVFSETGLKPMLFEVSSKSSYIEFFHLLSLQKTKMGNGTRHGDTSIDVAQLTLNVPGIAPFQADHTFGSVNSKERPIEHFCNHDEIEVIEKCFERVQHLGGDSQDYFFSLDDESWSLINSWSHLFSGLKARHCMVAGFINATDTNMQIKSTMLIEGGSPCYHIPSRDYDETSGVLRPGAAIIFFAWGMPPSLNNEGNIHMTIETNVFFSTLHNKNISLVSLRPSSGFTGVFLEKSLSDWWAKYWVLVSK